jgi:hypothetical protein
MISTDDGYEIYENERLACSVWAAMVEKVLLSV